MRRKEKEIRDKTLVEETLRLCAVGTLATIGSDGYPRVKPLNFAYREGAIYFHTAREGEKIDDIRRNDRVCFNAYLPIAYVKAKSQPCEANYLFRSVTIKGRARSVEDPGEKRLALDLLMQKHQPEEGLGDYPSAKLDVVGVVRIDVEEMTGKESLGDGSLREAALKALADRIPLPLVLER
jgi:nitroimidazol reductase NimA-like FMN-containing flavoprotein (pyridoxamine 5'-phosphate oxidase superfamily)